MIKVMMMPSHPPNHLKQVSQVKKPPKDKVNGWVVLDKPLHTHSTKAVAIIRRAFNAAKAGHAGTLDPLASGILPIALGEATKTIPYIMAATKDYEFEVAWGAETASDDLEGAVVATSPRRPALDAIEAVLPQFIGRIEQIPPTYSALKQGGRRAYDLARSNQPVVLASRAVDIHRLECLAHDPEHASSRFRAVTGKGVYIRALGRDMGRALGVYGHIRALRRTRVGVFSHQQSFSLDFFEKIAKRADASGADAFEALHSVLTALDDIPVLAVAAEDAERLRCGQKIEVEACANRIADDEICTALCHGRLVAMVLVSGRSVVPIRVFNL